MERGGSAKVWIRDRFKLICDVKVWGLGFGIGVEEGRFVLEDGEMN